MRTNPRPALLAIAFSLALTGLLSSGASMHAQVQAPPQVPAGPPQEPAGPTFRSGVAVVPITALVRDARNRIVRDLKRDDFQVLEQGQVRPIVDFKAKNDAAVSVGFLFDTSGSMRLALNLEKGIWFVQTFLNQMAPDTDEASLFTFHKALRQEVPFTSDRERIHQALGHVNPWGLTSLYDAIADSARRLAERQAPRRALVVISDGIDTSSRLTAEQVSKLASSIDVPVYILGVDATAATVEHLDDEKRPSPLEWTGRLDYLARWSGGAFLPAATPALTKLAADQIVSDLRSGYLMAFAPRNLPGWHRLTVKVSRSNTTVRTRGGFWMGQK